MPRYLKTLLLSGLLVLSALSGACSWFSSSKDSPKPEEEPKELSAKSSVSLDAPEANLFEDARRQYYNGMYSVAVETFEALRDAYPLGAYREFAEIKAADCRFELRSFPEAATLYEEFTKNHPVSVAVPYVLLKAARSRQLAQRGVGRDPTALNKAVESYKKLLEQYPDSVYAEAARVYKTEAEQELASYEKMVINFYKKANKEAAVAARENQFNQRWGKKSDDFEPLPVKSSYSETAKEVQPQAEENLPAAGGSPEPGAAPEASAVRQEAIQRALNLAQPQETQRTYLLRGVECNAEKKLLTIFTGAAFKEPDFLQANRLINIAHGQLTIRIPGLKSPDNREIKEDCLTANDLIVSADGTVSWTVEGSQAQLIDLDNPPRLLVLVK